MTNAVGLTSNSFASAEFRRKRYGHEIESGMVRLFGILVRQIKIVLAVRRQDARPGLRNIRGALAEVLTADDPGKDIYEYLFR